MSKLGEIGWEAPNAKPGDKLHTHAEIDSLFSEDEKALLSATSNELEGVSNDLETQDAPNPVNACPAVCTENGASQEARQEADEIMKEICQKLHNENVVFVQYAGGMKCGRGMGLEERQVVESIVRPIIEKLVDERDSARILHAHDNTFSHAVKRAKEAEEHAEQLQARVDDLERERAILIDWRRELQKENEAMKECEQLIRKSSGLCCGEWIEMKLKLIVKLDALKGGQDDLDR